MTTNSQPGPFFVTNRKDHSMQEVLLNDTAGGTPSDSSAATPEPLAGFETPTDDGPASESAFVTCATDLARDIDTFGSRAGRPSRSRAVGLDRAADNLIQNVLQKLTSEGFRLKVMVVGESGLGKTTLLNTLFRSPELEEHRECLQPALNAKTVRIEKRDTVISEGDFQLNLTVIDTPGYGDAINNNDAWDPILDYINAELEVYLGQEQDTKLRGMPVDTRVHACLYFVAPHRLKDVDLAFMRQLHQRVNLVPVIAKADTMTTRELAAYKIDICRKLRLEGIRTYPPLPTPDSLTALSCSDAARVTPPFAVIGSNELITLDQGIPETDIAPGAQAAGREYPWGAACIENPRHCDVGLLRHALVDNFVSLRDATHDIYQDFREEWAAGRRKTKHSALIHVVTMVVLTVVKMALISAMFHYPVPTSYTLGVLAAVILLIFFGIFVKMLVDVQFRDRMSVKMPWLVLTARFFSGSLLPKSRYDRKVAYADFAREHAISSEQPSRHAPGGSTSYDDQFSGAHQQSAEGTSLPSMYTASMNMSSAVSPPTTISAGDGNSNQQSLV